MPKPVPSPRRRSRRIAAGCLTLLLLTVAACGDDDAGSGDRSVGTQAAGEPLTVVAEDIGFPHDEYRVDAGEVEFVYENDGSIVHTLLIDGVDGFKLSVRSKGDVDEGSVELEAGEYELYCDIPGHRQGGMEAALVVS